jgi:ComF family protein
MNLIDDFIALFYPKTCPACGYSLYSNEKVICTKCLYHLPKTNFHQVKDNPVSKVFWGRVNLVSATAMYYYRKGGKVQHMIHQLKYKGFQEIGGFLGEIYGSELITMDEYKEIDLIIPVPLHRKKLLKRGFNQSEVIANGLAKSMEIEVDTTSVKRTVATTTQTRKSRYKRWENVNEIFELKNPDKLAGKHILVVDDVITTGATMEACVQVILQATGTKVSVAAIGFASH